MNTKKSKEDEMLAVLDDLWHSFVQLALDTRQGQSDSCKKRTDDNVDFFKNKIEGFKK